jgi:hypothetical protein
MENTFTFLLDQECRLVWVCKGRREKEREDVGIREGRQKGGWDWRESKGRSWRLG